jgi:hypothetical protein
VFGLLPSGVNVFQKAMDTSISAHIAQRIIEDAQQSEFDRLVDRANLPPDPTEEGYCPVNFSFRAPAVQNPGWRYFDEQGTEIRPRTSGGALTDAQKRLVVYQVNTRIRPRAALPLTGEQSGPVAQVTVQVARNPNLRELPLVTAENSAEANLFRSPVAVPVLTYSGLVGKIQGQ